MLASSLSWDNEVDLGVDPEQVSEVRATGVARASTWSAAALGAGQDVTAQDHDPRAHALAPPAKTLDQASGSTPVPVERGLQAYTAATLAGARKPFPCAPAASDLRENAILRAAGVPEAVFQAAEALMCGSS
jgi:hypothetical protein